MKTKTHYHKGSFKPKNTEKYIGNVNNITFRSGWEFKYMMFCDSNNNVIKWSSETVRIPYISPVDKDKFGRPKRRTYIVDFYMKIQTIGGEFREYLIEVKPGGNLIKPVLKGNITAKKVASYNKALYTFLVNKAKFDAAEKYAKTRGWCFSVVTQEKHPWLNV